jgi:hypothetical protein
LPAWEKCPAFDGGGVFWAARFFVWSMLYFFDKWERFHDMVSAVLDLPGFTEVQCTMKNGWCM